MYKMIAVTDETHICECCGKSNLKRVVVLENIETGVIVRYGVDCAAKALKVKGAVAKDYADIIVMTQKWLAKFGVESALRGISNRGYGCELKNGAIIIRGIGQVAV